MACPERESLQALLSGTFPAGEQEDVSRHVETCADCQSVLDSLTPASQSWEDVAPHLRQAMPAPAPELQKVIEHAKVNMDRTEADDRSTPRSHVSAVDETQAEVRSRPADVDLAFLEAPTKPEHLGRLGHYEILGVIGKGGFGVVLKGFDERLHRVVAIKVLSPAYAANGAARNRFIREARAVAAVKNEHVVGIYDVQGDAQPPYFVMECVDGISLQDKLDKHGPAGVKEVLRIGMQIAEGLAAAHKQGKIHRDIKPANILLENGVERVKITDFGLARAVDDASVTQSGTVAGTPMYMSPEQAEGLPIDHRSDLFSLGTVLYAMCTGHPPFRASGTHAVLKRVIDASPRPIREINNEIPEWLCDIIARLHAKKPEERIQSAKEVAELLEQHLAHLQQPSQAPMPIPVRPGSVQREAETDAVQAALRGPVIGLTATGLVNWIGFLAMAVVLGLVPSLRPPPYAIVIGLIVLPVGSTLILWGAAALYHGHSRRWGLFAADLALIIGPGYLIGLPIGIWTLAVLRRPDLRAALDAARPRTSADSLPARRRGKPAVVFLVLAAVVILGLWVIPNWLRGSGTIELQSNDAHVQVIVTAQDDSSTQTLTGNGEVELPAGFYYAEARCGSEHLIDLITITDWEFKKRTFPDGVDKEKMSLRVEKGQRTYIDVRVKPKEARTEPGWVQLFNGKDVTGWDVGPQIDWQVRDGQLFARGKVDPKEPNPVGPKEHEKYVLWTGKEYENYELNLQYRFTATEEPEFAFVFLHASGAPGDRQHVDVGLTNNRPPTLSKMYAASWGRLTMDSVAAPAPGEWNDVRIICKDRMVTVFFNGKQCSSASECTPFRGRIGLYVPHYQVAFRKVEIRELPSATLPETPEQVLPALAGAWKGEYTQKIYGGKADVKKINAVAVNDWIVGQKWLRQRVQLDNEGFQSVTSYEPGAKTFRDWFFHSRGLIFGPSTGRWDSATRTMTWTNLPEAGVLLLMTLRFVDANTLAGEILIRDKDGKTVFEMSSLMKRTTENVAIDENIAAGPMPPEMAALYKLVGDWEITGITKDAENPHGLKTTWPSTSRKILGGRVVSQQATGHPSAKWAYSLCTFDTFSKAYARWLFKLDGTVLEYGGGWDENTQTMKWHWAGRDGSQSSDTWRFRGAHRIEWQVLTKNAVGKTALDFQATSIRLSDPGWVQLFNGKDLTDLNVSARQGGEWSVKDGVLIGKVDEKKSLKTNLVTTRNNYRNFHARVEMRLTGKCGGGLLFHAASPNFVENYAMVNFTETPAKTIGLNVRKAKGTFMHHAPIGQRKLQDEWFMLEVIAQYPKVVYRINGETVLELGDVRFEPGHLALSVGMPSGAIEVRKFEINEKPTLPPAEPGWAQLFNGKDLTGWKLHPEEPGDWAVEHGLLVGKKGRLGYLLTDRDDYENFHLRAEVKLNAGGDSGVFVRARPGPFVEGKKPEYLGKKSPPGYEAQICNDASSFRTGSLFLVEQGKEPALTREERQLVKPEEWCIVEVIADGPWLTVIVNGQRTSNVKNDAYTRGHLALQMWHENTGVHFKKIEIKELPATPPTPPEPAFQPLFNGRDFTGWTLEHFPKNRNVKEVWTIENNALSCFERIGLLRTERSYGDYILQTEFMFPQTHIEEDETLGRARLELLLHTSRMQASKPDVRLGVHIDGECTFAWLNESGLKQVKGRVIGSKLAVKEWHKLRVEARGDTLEVFINGQPMGKLKDCDPTRGHIAISPTGMPVSFRNIEIKELPPTRGSLTLRNPAAFDVLGSFYRIEGERRVLVKEYQLIKEGKDRTFDLELGEYEVRGMKLGGDDATKWHQRLLVTVGDSKAIVFQKQD